MTLAEVLRAVAEQVPYLGASRVATGDGWTRCRVLLDDPARLAATIRATRAGFGTDDDAVAASLFVGAYAFRVAGVPIAAYALGLPVPGLAPETIAVRLDKPRPAEVAYLGAEVRTATAASLVHDLVDNHFGPLVVSVHERFRVGERLLWGDVAAAFAVAFRAVESSVAAAGAERAGVRARAYAFFDAGAAVFDGLGAFTTVEHDGREGWFWDRTSCCLWFRTTGSELCDNCNLIDPAELHARRVRQLAPDLQ